MPYPKVKHQRFLVLFGMCYNGSMGKKRFLELVKKASTTVVKKPNAPIEKPLKA
jgi:hypothetical protein